jgi:Family of unknown function (DUF5681)
MPFKKGESGNSKGRPRGAENKVTVELRDRIKLFLESNFKTVQKDFKRLDPEKRVALFERYLKFVLPQLQSTDVNLDFEKMSEQQLDEIINRILNKKQ